MRVMDGLAIDSFAGGGGASVGIAAALGREPDFAINHNAEALALHAANHPCTIHLTEDVWKVKPTDLAAGRTVAMLWMSPDCRHFSKAKGSAPVSPRVRGLAWVALRWAKSVRPKVIFLENVEEFEDWGPLTRDGKPCVRRKGQTFAEFVIKLERQGYRVERRTLRASDYGAPTVRNRLFVVARCDGLPIVWPETSHAAPTSPEVARGEKKPWRTAAEIIDWNMPCPSIFDTAEVIFKKHGVRAKRPLEGATLARIAKGIKRYVLDAKNPFIVSLPGGDATAPIVGVGQHGGRSRPVQSPLQTVTASLGDQNQIIAPHLMTMRNSQKPHTAMDEPTHTVTAQGAGLSMVTPFLVPRYGERPGQEPRSMPADKPMATVVPTSNQGSLAAVFLAQNNTGMVGHDARKPMSSIVGWGSTQSVVEAALLSNFYSSNKAGGTGDVREPVPTVTAEGNHQARIGATLVPYYGTEKDGQGVDEPVRTVTSVARFGVSEIIAVPPPLSAEQLKRARAVADFLREHGCWTGGDVVTVGPYIIADIGLRMLTPRELARAQGFPEHYRLEIDYQGRPMTRAAQTRMIGNSVCPQVAEALVRANVVMAAAMRPAPTYRPWGDALKRRLVAAEEASRPHPSLFEREAA